jgi:hypothetical protein
MALQSVCPDQSAAIDCVNCNNAGKKDEYTSWPMFMTLPTGNHAVGTCRLQPQRNGQHPHFSTYTKSQTDSTSTMMTARAVRAGLATVTRSSPSRQKHAPSEPSPFSTPNDQVAIINRTTLRSFIYRPQAYTAHVASHTPAHDDRFTPHVPGPVCHCEGSEADEWRRGVAAGFFRQSTR